MSSDPSSAQPLLLPRSFRNASGFTLVELLATLAIVAILFTLLSAGLSQIRLRAGQATCAGNLRQIGSAFISYTADNGGQFPPHWGIKDGLALSWYGFIAPYVSEWDGTAEASMTKTFYCPSSSRRFNPTQNYQSLASNVDQSYGYNHEYLSGNPQWGNSFRRLSIKGQSKLVIVADIPTLNDPKDVTLFPSSPAWITLYPSSARGVSRRHSEGANFLFMDSHVERRNSADFLGKDFDIENWLPSGN